MEKLPFKRARAALIAFVAILLFGSGVVYVEPAEGASGSSGAVTLTPSRYASGAMANGFNVTLSYEEPIRCGEPVTFTVNASGRSGEFKYLIYAMYEKDTYNSIQDFSFGGMQDSPEFNITFDYNCDVDLVIQVTDKNSLGTYTRPVFTFSVNDVGSFGKDEIAGLSEAKAKRVYEECMSQGFASQYEKALWLHDWVIDNCVYDRTYRHMSASDLFVFGTGTCEAYHAAYMDLLRRAGIECGRVSDNGHVWTLAKLDGEWCHIDTTGDDTDGDRDDWYLGKAGRCRLFGLNDDIVTAYIKTQDPDKEIKVKNPLVAATSLKNNYLIRSGEIRKYSDAYRAGVQAAIDRGEESFALSVNNSAWPSSYKTLVNSLVAYQLSSEAWYRQGKPVSLGASYANDVLAFSIVEQTQPAPAEAQAMYRLYNRITGEHFYTASAYERDVLKAGDWNYEGVGWYAPSSGSPVYRLYNPGLGDHHYTTNGAERDMLVREAGWNYEGIGWYSGGTKPLYRQYNPGLRIGQHNYTANAGERDALIAYHGWRDEGVGWYGL